MRKNLSSPNRKRRKASPKRGTPFSQLDPIPVKSLCYLGSPRREADHLEEVRESPRGHRNPTSSLRSPRMSWRITTTLWGPINTIQIICTFLTAVRESQRRRTKNKRKLESQSLHLVSIWAQGTQMMTPNRRRRSSHRSRSASRKVSISLNLEKVNPKRRRLMSLESPTKGSRPRNRRSYSLKRTQSQYRRSPHRKENLKRKLSQVSERKEKIRSQRRKSGAAIAQIRRSTRRKNFSTWTKWSWTSTSHCASQTFI